MKAAMRRIADIAVRSKVGAIDRIGDDRAIRYRQHHASTPNPGCPQNPQT